MTALLRGACGCQVLRQPGLTLLEIKDTRLVFGRVVLFSGCPLGSVCLGGWTVGTPCAHSQPGWLPLLHRIAVAGRKGIEGFCFKNIENEGKINHIPSWWKSIWRSGLLAAFCQQPSAGVKYFPVPQNPQLGRCSWTRLATKPQLGE